MPIDKKQVEAWELLKVLEPFAKMADERARELEQRVRSWEASVMAP